MRQLLLLATFLGAFLAASTLSISAAVEARNSADEEAGEHKLFLPMATNVPTFTSCRYGVNNRPGLPGNQWMTVVGVGHYINFRTDPVGTPVPNSVQLMPQVRIKQNRQNGNFVSSYTVTPSLTMAPGGLGEMVAANPGLTWLAGNEPDVDNIVQDSMLPEMYATAYHDIYHFIKGIDPYAHVAIAGLSMMTPGRLQYLDIVWDTYLQKYGQPMPVDVWNTHIYILPEIRFDGSNSDGKVALGTNPALAKKEPLGDAVVECPKNDVYCRAEHDDINIFKSQILALRSWMKDHGQQDKPLLVSEFSLLYPFVDYDDPVNPTQCFLMDELGQCFTQNRVIEFMQNTLDFMEKTKDNNLGYAADDYRLVQQWAWYSMWTGAEMSGASSNLLVHNHEDFSPDTPAALTYVGEAYRDRTVNSARNINLVAGAAPKQEVKAQGGTADVEISLGYANDGSTFIMDPFTVTFYANAGLTQKIGETKVFPGHSGLIDGCSWGRITDWASVTWSDVPVGSHTFWAKVDSKNNIQGETSESDNVVSGQVVVMP